MQLPAGVRVRLEFDEARIERDQARPADETLLIEAGETAGAGEIQLQGRRYRVSWRTGQPDDAGAGKGWTIALVPGEVRFPLHLRGWQPGDRMRTTGGGKSLKKLFLESRIPRSVRARLPVLADASGEVLWVGAVPRGPIRRPGAGEDALILSVLDA